MQYVEEYKLTIACRCGALLWPISLLTLNRKDPKYLTLDYPHYLKSHAVFARCWEHAVRM